MRDRSSVDQLRRRWPILIPAAVLLFLGFGGVSRDSGWFALLLPLSLVSLGILAVKYSTQARKAE